MEEWQERWNRASKCRRTHRPIPKYGMLRGEVDFYLTQLIGGHCCFRSYLRRFKVEQNPFCSFCKCSKGAEHVVFLYSKYLNERQRLEMENSDSFLSRDLKIWKKVVVLATSITRKRRNEERQRKLFNCTSKRLLSLRGYILAIGRGLRV